MQYQHFQYRRTKHIPLNMEGDYLLHIACHMKELHIIKILLERKCNTKIPNNKGETAHNTSLNEAGDCLLHVACQWGNVGIARHLITDEKCNPNLQSFTSKDTPLHIAAKFGLDNILVEILSSKDCNLIFRTRRVILQYTLLLRRTRQL